MQRQCMVKRTVVHSDWMNSQDPWDRSQLGGGGPRSRDEESVGNDVRSVQNLGPGLFNGLTNAIVLNSNLSFPGLEQRIVPMRMMPAACGKRPGRFAFQF